MGVIDKNWKKIVVDFMQSLDPKTESILKAIVFNRSRTSFDITFTDQELDQLKEELNEKKDNEPEKKQKIDEALDAIAKDNYSMKFGQVEQMNQLIAEELVKLKKDEFHLLFHFIKEKTNLSITNDLGPLKKLA